MTAVPLRLAGPCLKRSVGGMEPILLGPKSPSCTCKEIQLVPAEEMVWCARGPRGWAPLMLAEAPLCCKHHLANSPVRSWLLRMETTASRVDTLEREGWKLGCLWGIVKSYRILEFYGSFYLVIEGRDGGTH